MGRVVGGVRLALHDIDYELVLVDDGSADDTVGAARAALGEEAHRLRVVSHAQKSGYAQTVCDGLRAARGSVLSFMDGDGQFDPDDIRQLLARLHTADLVAGYRKHRADPMQRSVISHTMNVLVRMVYGVRERDVDCGLKVMRREVFDSALPILARSALFNTELYFKAHRNGFRVVQLAVEHRPRVAGRRSGARLVPIARAVRDVVRLRWRLARSWTPRRVPLETSAGT
jgi:glycosyltransferase involved in cell wall biosynthesis